MLYTLKKETVQKERNLLQPPKPAVVIQLLWLSCIFREEIKKNVPYLHQLQEISIAYSTKL